MKVLRKSVDRLKSPSRRRQKDVGAPPVFITLPSSAITTSTAKRPSITMLPRDSASSLNGSQSPAPAMHNRRPPQAPLCGKRPGLADILAGTSQRPWTLDAFRMYCEQNLCVENLLFIQEARDYEMQYKRWLDGMHSPPNSDDDSRRGDLILQWQQMLLYFIATGGAQEVNLSGDVRDALLAVPCMSSPPDPQLLTPAVSLTHRLIEDSILFPFLNEIRHDCTVDDEVSSPHNHNHSHKDDLRLKVETVRIDTTSTSRPSSRDAPSPTSNISLDSFALSTHHTSRQARLASRPRSLFTPSKDVSLSSGSASIETVMFDERAPSVESPSLSHGSSQTPPISPAVSDSGVSGERPRPRSDSSGWKKFSARLGFAKKGRSNSQLRTVRTGESALSD